jgi:hypothetical protein
MKSIPSDFIFLRKTGMSEMILESITGVGSPTLPDNTGRSKRFLEATAFRVADAFFYKDVVARIPVCEVSRLPQKFKQENGETIKRKNKNKVPTVV